MARFRRQLSQLALACTCWPLVGCLSTTKPAPLEVTLPTIDAQFPTMNHARSAVALPQPTDTWPSEVVAVSQSDADPVPPLPPLIVTNEGGEPAALAQLQQQALAHSPAMQQALADIAAARGGHLQAGLYPNPTFGYQGDQIGSGKTAGQQGFFFNQTIITYGKLQVAQAAALADVAKAQAALRQTQIDLAAQVRAKYFALVAADEAVRIADQMARTSEALFERIKKLQESGQAIAGYEVAQARASAMSARTELAQAENRRTAARKQLANLAGIADLPTGDLTGDIPLPRYSYDLLRQRMLTQHSELLQASANVQKARHEVELARLTPRPNIGTNTYVQYDYQTQTPQVGVQIGVTIPYHDRNQGNIAQAEANLVRASKEVDRVKLDLTQRLAETYERYSSNAKMLEQYRTNIVPDQLKAFQGISKRYEAEPGKVNFPEVVQAQINLAKNYQDYLTALNNTWQAVAELSRLVQMDDLYREFSLPPDQPLKDSWHQNKP